jgi:hypothetical protein
MAISSVLGSSALLPAGLGFRNVLINGGFDVWQRGTSAAFTTSASTSFLADRWSGYRGAAGSTQSRVSAGLDGFQYAMRVQRDSGNTSVFRQYIGTSLETSTATKLANKPVVLSFYARAGANYSSASNGLNVLLSSGTGTEANGVHVNFTSATSVVSTVATLTTSYQRFTYFATMPATSSQLLVQFDFAGVGTAGAADYFDITGVQLEQNYQPTPFEQRPIGVELALCQRYYALVASGVNSHIGTGAYGTNTQIEIQTSVPVSMRTTPTIAVVTGTNYYVCYGLNFAADYLNSIAVDVHSADNRWILLYNNSEVSATAGNPAWLRGNDAAARVAFSAEL